MKNVLFITTKNLDYLRNTQEIRLIKEQAEECTVVGYSDRSYIKRLCKVYAKLLFSSLKKYDVIFIGFAPQLILPLFGLKMRKKTIVMDFFISVYDTMVCDRRKFRKNGPAAKLCHFLDRKCIGYANQVICDTNAHGDYFAEEFGVERSKIHTLYLEADTSIYYERTVTRPEALQDKYIVLYFGSILPLQGVEVIMGAIERLKEHKDLYFYVIGPMKDSIRKVESSNVEYIEWLPQEKLAEYIAMADLCLAGHFNRQIKKAKRTIPGKAYIYEAMNRKMILGDNKANRELFTEDDRHFFVKMGEEKALAEKILSIKALAI